MRGRLAALLLVVLVACDGGGGEQAAPSTTTTTRAPTTTTAPCEPGGQSLTLRGVRVRRFCGPALAEVTVGGELLVFPGGECTRHEDWFALNIGIEVIDAEPGDERETEFRSFTVLMGRHPLAGAGAAPVAADGNYTEALITFAAPGRTWLVEDKTVTLVATRTAGVFSGTGFAGVQGPSGPIEREIQGHDQPLHVEGVFTCDSGAIPVDRVPALVRAP